MKIGYLTRIHNESELIYYNLKYYLNLGVNGFFITLNNSDQRTIEKVNNFFKEYPKLFHKIYIEKNEEYNQPEIFNKMSDNAFSYGFKWQIPNDADELLIIRNNSLKNILSQYDKNFEYGYINMKWIDYQASEKDNQLDENFFTRWKYREPVPRPPTKIIYKWSPGCKHGQGHHLLIAKRKLIDNILPEIMFKAHFVNREYEQIKYKRIRIGEAFIKKYGYESNKPQINEYKLYENQGNDYFKLVWKKICQYRKKNFDKFIYDPINKKLFS